MGEPRTGADHVGDRIERANLVEGDVVRVGAVDGGLGPGETFEHPQREEPDRVVEIGVVEQGPDVAPGTVGGRVGDLDVAAGGGEAVPGDLLDAQGHRFGGDGVDGVRAGVIGEIGVNGQERGSLRYLGEITPDEEKVLRAASRACLESGAALCI